MRGHTKIIQTALRLIDLVNHELPQDSPHTPGNMHVLRFGEHEVSANTTPTTIGYVCAVPPHNLLRRISWAAIFSHTHCSA